MKTPRNPKGRLAPQPKVEPERVVTSGDGWWSPTPQDPDRHWVSRVSLDRGDTTSDYAGPQADYFRESHMDRQDPSLYREIRQEFFDENTGRSRSRPQRQSHASFFEEIKKNEEIAKMQIKEFEENEIKRMRAEHAEKLKLDAIHRRAREKALQEDRIRTEKKEKMEKKRMEVESKLPPLKRQSQSKDPRQSTSTFIDRPKFFTYGDNGTAVPLLTKPPPLPDLKKRSVQSQSTNKIKAPPPKKKTVAWHPTTNFNNPNPDARFTEWAEPIRTMKDCYNGRTLLPLAEKFKIPSPMEEMPEPDASKCHLMAHTRTQLAKVGNLEPPSPFKAPIPEVKPQKLQPKFKLSERLTSLLDQMPKPEVPRSQANSQFPETLETQDRQSSPPNDPYSQDYLQKLRKLCRNLVFHLNTPVTSEATEIERQKILEEFQITCPIQSNEQILEESKKPESRKPKTKRPKSERTRERSIEQTEGAGDATKQFLKDRPEAFREQFERATDVSHVRVLKEDYATERFKEAILAQNKNADTYVYEQLPQNRTIGRISSAECYAYDDLPEDRTIGRISSAECYAYDHLPLDRIMNGISDEEHFVFQELPQDKIRGKKSRNSSRESELEEREKLIQTVQETSEPRRSRRTRYKVRSN